MTNLAIDVKGLTKRFGKKVAVDHVDIAIPEGEVWGFLGPNGSGKTTTIRMLCGLLHADEGQGTCLGLDFRTQSEAIKRQVGYIPSTGLLDAGLAPRPIRSAGRH